MREMTVIPASLQVVFCNSSTHSCGEYGGCIF